METINKVQGTRITRVYSAKFYFFKYITGEDNKWFNIFPLVFSLGKKGRMIQGLDFHYLPIKMRIPLIEELKLIKPDMVKSPVAFARYFKRLMWTQRKWRPAQVCYKRYDIGNIRGGKIIRIERGDWERTLLQPKVEKFVTSTLGKVASGRVWRESIKKMRTG